MKTIKVPEIKISFTVSDMKNRPTIFDIKDTRAIIDPFFQDIIFHHEEIWAILINNSNKVLGVVQLGVGGTCSCTCNTTVLYQSMILANAIACIVVHNHPSGNVRPSKPDDLLTQQILKGLELFDMRLLDHLIITPEDYYSYSMEGRL